MAKSRSFFGLRTGSTKSLTFQVNQGKQITKDRVSIVKNPRSLMQMQQRMLLATVSAAYSAMKTIVDHSFEGIAYGQKSMSEFVKLNMQKISADFNGTGDKFGYNEYKNRLFHAGPYAISRGSASPIDTNKITATAGAAAQTLAIAAAGTASANPTANQLAAALGLNVGEMCTLCIVADALTEAGEAYDKFTFVRIKFDAAGDVALSDANIGSYFTIESPNELTLTLATTGLTIDVAMAAAGTSICFAAIHSVKADGAWLRSDCDIILPGSWEITPSPEQAIATYPVGSDYILNGGAV